MSKINRRSALGIGLAAATAAVMKPAAAQNRGLQGYDAVARSGGA
jgi:hypothetical protein